MQPTNAELQLSSHGHYFESNMPFNNAHARASKQSLYPQSFRLAEMNSHNV
jgi:hypothetical protein